jgi:pimeloyl-ACP methyl ester carboxylesterase
MKFSGMTRGTFKPARTPKIPKVIALAALILQAVSPYLAMRFAARLFTTPIKHKIPKRELGMDHKSRQQKMVVPAIGKAVVVYHFGDGPGKVLLVHGWSGRGTQLARFADALLKAGYMTVSFDAPAHGKSTGKTSIMPEFIASIHEIDRNFGPFEAAIGHSLGGMSLLNAVSEGFQTGALVTIGSGDIIRDIMDDFVAKLKLRPGISDRMRKHFEQKSPRTMDSYSSYIAAQNVKIPVLVVHDERDAEVPVSCAHHIARHLEYGRLMLTEGLGHRKILGNLEVVLATMEFIKTKNYEKSTVDDAAVSAAFLQRPIEK